MLSYAATATVVGALRARSTLCACAEAADRRALRTAAYDSGHSESRRSHVQSADPGRRRGRGPRDDVRQVPSRRGGARAPHGGADLRPIKLVVHDFEPDWDTYVERPGRTCPVDVAFADVDPSRYAALVIPGGRAPEFIRVDPDVARIVEHFFVEGKPVGTLCHGPQVPRRSGSCAGGGAPASARSRPTSRWPEASTWTGRGDRRKHGLVPRLGRSRGVVACVSRVGRPRRSRRVATRPSRLAVACPVDEQ